MIQMREAALLKKTPIDGQSKNKQRVIANVIPNETALSRIASYLYPNSSPCFM